MGGAPSARPHSAGIGFAAMAVALLLIAVAAAGALAPAQSDTFWALRAGKEFWDGGGIALTDTYTHTITGAEWPNHAWLWQAAAYGSYLVGGFPLLALLSAVTAVLAVWLSFTAIPGDRRHGALLLLPAFAMIFPAWSLRPQMTSLLLFAVLLRLIIRQRYWWIPPLFLLWANLHGAVAYGGALLATATAVAVVRWWRIGSDEELHRMRTLLVVTPLSALATLVNPMGIGLWLYITRSIPRSWDNGLQEWRNSFYLGFQTVPFWIAVLAFIVCVAKYRDRLRGWPEQSAVAMALVMVPLAAGATRNIAAFAITALPALIALLAPIGPRSRPDPPRRLHTAVVAVFGALMAAIVAVAWTSRLPGLSWDPLPSGAIEAVDACSGPLYNEYYDGGFFIWYSPDVPVFVDNRQDPFPQDFLQRSLTTSATGDYEEVFDEYGIGCAALPAGSVTAQRLAQGGWTPAFRDDDWVVLYPPAAR